MPKDERTQIIKDYEKGVYQDDKIVGYVDDVHVSNDHSKVMINRMDDSQSLNVNRPFTWRGFLLKADNPNPELDSIIGITNQGASFNNRSNIMCSVLTDNPNIKP